MNLAMVILSLWRGSLVPFTLQELTFTFRDIYRPRLSITDFETEKVLGRGTFGSVLLVYKKDDNTKRRLALKLISKEVIRQKVND